MSSYTADTEKLKQIIISHHWLMSKLELLRPVAGVTCYIGAGAVRDSVWDAMSGITHNENIRDIDVVYFNPDDLSVEHEQTITSHLQRVAPEDDWDVKNQARVHLWFKEKFGYPVDPLRSVAGAVATWPEYASAVAVRLRRNDELEVVAPFGLRDLLEMRIRRNPVRVTVEQYRNRVASKSYPQRWPKVTVIEE